MCGQADKSKPKKRKSKKRRTGQTCEKIMKKKRIKMLIGVCALVLLIAVGSTMAYFTDADTQTNTFLIGKISLDLQEPNWDPDEGIHMTPMKTVKKDPQIMNDGVNDEFVFLEVVVPYANVVTANADGTKNPAADTELFNYTINKGWVEMTEQKKMTENTVTHLYAWGTKDKCAVLKKDVTTGTLFDTVTMARIVEDQGLEQTRPEIVINAYGIQTSYLDGSKDSPADVWSILSKQAPGTETDEAEDPKTDVKEGNQPKEQEPSAGEGDAAEDRVTEEAEEELDAAA